MTSRNFYKRIAEHAGRSFRTNSLLSHLVMQFEKNTFVFFRKKLFFMTKKTWPLKKTLKKCFFCFFYNKLCIKEKRKVVLLIWGPGDPVCPITPPTPSCRPLCGSVCGNWPNFGLLCKLVAKTFFYMSLWPLLLTKGTCHLSNSMIIIRILLITI